MITGIAHGSFDLLHIGHMMFFHWCKTYLNSIDSDNQLVVLLSSDKRVKEIKGETRPYLNSLLRQFSLLQLRTIDQVLISHNGLPEIEEIEPDYFFKGEDTDINSELFKDEKELLVHLDCSLILVPIELELHTTDILNGTL